MEGSAACNLLYELHSQVPIKRLFFLFSFFTFGEVPCKSLHIWHQTPACRNHTGWYASGFRADLRWATLSCACKCCQLLPVFPFTATLFTAETNRVLCCMQSYCEKSSFSNNTCNPVFLHYPVYCMLLDVFTAHFTSQFKSCSCTVYVRLCICISHSNSFMCGICCNCR